MNAEPKLTSLIISKQFPDFDNSEENSDEEGKIGKFSEINSKLKVKFFDQNIYIFMFLFSDKST